MPHKSEHALTGRDIRCLLFDLGDTLWTRGDASTWELLETTGNLRAVALLRAYIAPQHLPQLDDEALGQYLRRSLNENVRNVIRNIPDIEPDGPLVVIQTLQQWGIEGIDRTFANEIFEALRVRIPESRPLFPDTLSTLKVLQQRGFLLGIVTNRLWGGEPFQQDLQTLGLLNYFEPCHMAISADLGVRKPNPAIFLHALNALDVEPRYAAMIGDSLQADMVGALSLGIFSIWKPKARVLHEIQTRTHAPGIIATSRAARPNTGVPTPDPSVDDPSPASPPLDIYATDDDIILASIQKHDDYLEQYIRGEIQPDLVIERLSDLLDIFSEVGVQ